MQFLRLLRFAVRMELRRTAADWRLQVAAGFGVLLAVALMASSVIFSNALRETALQHTLRGASDLELDLAVGVPTVVSREALDESGGLVQQRVVDPLQEYLTYAPAFVQTSTFFLSGLPQFELPTPQRPRGPIHAVTGLDDHIDLLEGRSPRIAQDELEVIIDALGAEELRLSVGERFEIFPAVTIDETALPFPVKVVGIFEPRNPDDQFWQVGFPKRYTRTDDSWVTIPMYTSVDALAVTLGPSFPGLRSNSYRLLFLDREGLRATEVDALRVKLRTAFTDVFILWPSSTWETELESLLDEFDSLFTLARIPLLLLVFIAIGMLLYYLFLIAGLMGRVRAPEMALLRSRGASIPQVGLLLLLEGLVLSVPAVILGPFTALALVNVTGSLFPAAAGGMGLEAVDLSRMVFLMGAGGALLAVMVLTLTTLSTARHGMVEFRRAGARPEQMPFLHRYYLDLAALGFIALAWWQLQSRGTFLVQSLTGDDLEIDTTLLLGPVLGVMGMGLLLFRFFPWVVLTMSWILDPVAPMWMSHALRRVGRAPVQLGSILLLLALAVSLGVLASTLTATLERGQQEQALYAAGADLRVSHNLGEWLVQGESVAESLESVPGVLAAMDVVRSNSRVVKDGGSSAVDVLGVQPIAFPDVAWTRGDFSDGSVAELLESIVPEERAPAGLLLPADADSLSIWVETGLLSRSVDLLARLRDSEGVYFDVGFGSLIGRGWRRLEAPLEPVGPAQRRFGGQAAQPTDPGITPVPPYTLHTLWVRSGFRGVGTGALFLDQLEALTPNGPVDIASLQRLEEWHVLEDASSPGLSSLEESEAVARSGRRSVGLTWSGSGSRAGIRGMRYGMPETALPAIVSPSFLEKNEADVGEVLTIAYSGASIPIQIVRVAKFLPTLFPEDRPFLVMDLRSLMEFTALRVQTPLEPLAEAWLQLDEGVEVPSVLEALSAQGGSPMETFVAADMVAARVGDPLLIAGWSGLLALSFVTVLLASSSGLILYMYIDTRERSEEFALLRTIGFSSMQINGVLWFNLSLAVVSGALLGTVGGRWLSSSLIPLLEMAEEGVRVTPPMVLETNWAVLGATYGMLAVAAVATVGALAWAVSHLDVQRVLRHGEG